MIKVGHIVQKWISVQKDFAQELGVSDATLSLMLTGKQKFPMPRFVQTVFLLRPPQKEINKAFNIYLSRLNLPHDSVMLHVPADQPEPSADEKIDNILKEVMGSDLDPAAKVKIYNIITQNR
jgi:hypothetical protein